MSLDDIRLKDTMTKDITKFVRREVETQEMKLNGDGASVLKSKEHECRGVAQPGSAPALGAGGRAFESPRPDHLVSSGCTLFRASRKNAL